MKDCSLFGLLGQASGNEAAAVFQSLIREQLRSLLRAPSMPTTPGSALADLVWAELTRGFRMDSEQLGSRGRSCGTTARPRAGTPNDNPQPRCPDRRHGSRGTSPAVVQRDR
jgi:hypothetical protein